MKFIFWCFSSALNSTREFGYVDLGFINITCINKFDVLNLFQGILSIVKV